MNKSKDRFMGRPKNPEILIVKHDKFSDMAWYLGNRDVILDGHKVVPIDEVRQ